MSQTHSGLTHNYAQFLKLKVKERKVSNAMVDSSNESHQPNRAGSRAFTKMGILGVGGWEVLKFSGDSH